jgi:CRP/FNR family cyclic AMP-dependent transcriptional regulator
VDLEAYDAGVRAAIASGRLAGLSPAVMGRLAESSVLTVVPSRALYPYDPHSQLLALVVEGLLRTFVLAADGRQITLRYSRPGALVGAASLYAENSVFVQLQALVDTRLLLLRPAQVRALARSEASVANLLLLELGERTTAYMEMIAATGLSSVRQKVVRHLLDLAAEGSGGALIARLTQQELADHVGTVREVVARILRELREEGLINTSRDQIVLVDPTRLHARTWPGNG